MRLALVSVLLCSLASVTVAGDTSKCPTGFAQHGNSCYWFSNVRGSFAEARGYCQFLRSHLARITSKEEDDFVRHKAKELGRGFWLGATDLITEGAFRWEGGVPLNYTNWIPGQPDNENIHNNPEHCLMIAKRGNRWNDLECVVEIYFICERRVAGCCCSN
ncbi:perlucin-like [Haliotis rufescens]|uniref:perlucin-like n=1 Tax=Haliotis rufescens TaxID=6454 RepID=UPI00201F16A2|nr:perlucin-like [Haliotis rufescens]